MNCLAVATKAFEELNPRFVEQRENELVQQKSMYKWVYLQFNTVRLWLLTGILIHTFWCVCSIFFYLFFLFPVFLNRWDVYADCLSYIFNSKDPKAIPADISLSFTKAFQFKLVKEAA